MLVSAADDFLLFRRLMFRRNLQLEREARSVAARIYGARLDHSAAQGRPTAPPQPSAKEKEALHGEAEEQRRRETEEEERLIEVGMHACSKERSFGRIQVHVFSVSRVRPLSRQTFRCLTEGRDCQLSLREERRALQGCERTA